MPIKLRKVMLLQQKFKGKNVIKKALPKYCQDKEQRTEKSNNSKAKMLSEKLCQNTVKTKCFNANKHTYIFADYTLNKYLGFGEFVSPKSQSHSGVQGSTTRISACTRVHTPYKVTGFE
jgi:hypothetical protein